MCIYCLEGDSLLTLRKSSAFPRKMVAEAVEDDSAVVKADPSVGFSCDTPEAAAPPSAWPKRKSTPS
jgi:hypothetical protein